MDYTTLFPARELPKDAGNIDRNCLYAVFEQIKDGRKKRGQRYSLPLLLTLLLLARLAGETEISAAAEWIRLRSDWICEHLQIKRQTMPCTGTYLYLLSRIDHEQVTQLVAAYLIQAEARQRCGEEPSRLRNQAGREHREHVALDGKTLRGTLGHVAEDQPPVHILSLYEVKTGVVLTQRVVREKENEISAAKEMALPQYVKGRVITADAIHTQKSFCQQIHRAGGKYLLYVKENHPTDYEDLAFFFEDAHADRSQWHTSQSTEKGHGRLTTRTITTSTEMNAWFDVQWAGIVQVFRIERCVVRKGKTSKQVVYGWTNFTPHEAGPEAIGGFSRDHWAIENRLHWRRDVTLNEDHSQLRSKGKPPVLAVLNNTVLALMDWLGVRNVPAHMRRYAAHPHLALALLIRSL